MSCGLRAAGRLRALTTGPLPVPRSVSMHRKLEAEQKSAMELVGVRGGGGGGRAAQ